MNCILSHYEAIADVYDELYPPCPELNHEVATQIRSVFRYRPCVIAELGSGTGSFVASIRPLLDNEQAEAVAVDANLSMCRRSKDKGVRTLCADFNHLPLREERVHIVIFKEAVHHAEGPQKLAVEIDRILGPGGLVIFIVQSEWRIEPTRILASLVELARAKRRPSRDVVAPMMLDSWQTRVEKTISCRTMISRRFVELALKAPVLTYWREVERPERMKLWNGLQEEMGSSITLVRNFDIYVLQKHRGR